MRIYYKNKKGDILDTRKLFSLHSIKDDELNYVPRIGETVCAGSRMYKVKDVITDLINDTITVILV